MGLKTWGVTSPPPYFGIVLSVYTKQESKSQNLFKTLWVLCLHGIFMLPGSIYTTIVGPLNFYQLYSFILEHFGFFVQSPHWIDLKVSLCLYLNQIPNNNMVNIMYNSYCSKISKVQVLEPCYPSVLYFLAPILGLILQLEVNFSIPQRCFRK